MASKFSSTLRHTVSSTPDTRTSNSIGRSISKMRCSTETPRKGSSRSISLRKHMRGARREIGDQEPFLSPCSLASHWIGKKGLSVFYRETFPDVKVITAPPRSSWPRKRFRATAGNRDMDGKTLRTNPRRGHACVQQAKASSLSDS